MKRRGLVWVGVVGALVVIGLLAAVRDAGRRTWRAELPALPRLDRSPAAMRDQLTRADALARAKSGSAEAAGALAMAYHASAFLEPARTAYALAARTDRSNAKWPYLLATLEVAAGENERAVTFLTESLERDAENPHAWARLGQLYYRREETADAERALRRALELDASHPHAAVDLARLLGGRDAWDEAVRVLEPAIRVHPNYGPAHRMLALALENLGRSDEARRHEELGSDIGLQMLDPLVHELYAQSASGDALVTQAQIAQSWGDMRRAHELLSRAVTVAPNDRDVRLAMGRFLMAAGGDDREQVRVALDHLAAAVVLDTTYVASRHDHASALLAMGDTTRAVAEWTRILREEPAHAMAHMALGDVAYAQKRFAEAAARYEEGLAVAPDTPFRLGNRGQGHRRLGATYAALGRVEQAASCYEDAVEESDAKAEVYGEWARMLRENGRAAAGDALLRRAVAADSTDARLHLVFGNYLLQARAFAAAEPELAAAVRWNPNDAAAYAAWGYVTLELGDVDGAITRLRRSIELRSSSPLAHYHLGNAYARKGDRNAAAGEYQAALAARPGFRPAMEALADLNRR